MSAAQLHDWLLSGGTLGGPGDLVTLALLFCALALAGAVLFAAVLGPVLLVRRGWAWLRAVRP